MIQLALRSSTQALDPFASTRSARIDGNATAVIISSSPARKTPVPNTASSTSAERRVIAASVSAPGYRPPPGAPLQEWLDGTPEGRGVDSRSGAPTPRERPQDDVRVDHAGSAAARRDGGVGASEWRPSGPDAGRGDQPRDRDPQRLDHRPDRRPCRDAGSLGELSRRARERRAGGDGPDAAWPDRGRGLDPRDRRGDGPGDARPAPPAERRGCDRRPGRALLARRGRGLRCAVAVAVLVRARAGDAPDGRWRRLHVRVPAAGGLADGTG